MHKTFSFYKLGPGIGDDGRYVRSRSFFLLLCRRRAIGSKVDSVQFAMRNREPGNGSVKCWRVTPASCTQNLEV